MPSAPPQRRLEGAMGAKVAVRHKPHGVLAVLGPYNFPAHLPNGHIVPALIAGNAVVFKPSEKTPAVGEFLVDCFHEAGVPEGVVRCCPAGPRQGKALAAQPGIDGLLFTGSARAGLALHRQFAETPHKILALEMGGNNPLVVWDAKDIHAAATIAVQSAYLSRRPALHRGAAADRRGRRARGPLVEAIGKLIDRLIVDHPHAEPAPFMGPVIDNAAADQLQEAFLELMRKGGKPIRRLDRPSDDRPFLTPALIDVTDVERPARRGDVRAGAADHPGPRFRRRDRRGQRHPLRPRRLPDRRQPRALRPLLGQYPRRRDQLEQADQRRPVQRPVRRHRPVAATTARAPITPPIIAPIR